MAVPSRFKKLFRFKRYGDRGRIAHSHNEKRDAVETPSNVGDARTEKSACCRAAGRLTQSYCSFSEF
ncbi:hypothetical protein DPMN_040896 [Dreissena polymorpha]|uniref:Uncharacterized protein n=1 Tax=Dreissena polymorpha TaxID=45954 RepID=A0A9D4CXR9_DREPO|nr:hypothetical protein DPMN_040896 [Dreissena polymorpha]